MSVVTGHRELHVRDFDRKAGLPPDLYRLVDRLPEVTILASDVADVPAAERRRLPRQGKDFLGLRINPWVVLQPCTEPERARLHLLA